MSLELAITENTSAIRELIAALAHGVPTTAAQVAAVVAEAPAEQPQATVGNNGASSTRGKSSTAAAAAHTPAPDNAASTVPAAASVTYEDVKAIILKLSGAKKRDAVVALLGEFGAAKGPDLKPEQFADFIAKATNVLAS